MQIVKNHNELIVGLDIGSSKITGVIAKEENGKITLKAVTSVPVSDCLQRGEVINIKNTVNGILKVVANLKKECPGLEIGEVISNINGADIAYALHSNSKCNPFLNEDVTISQIMEMRNDARKLGSNNGYQTLCVEPLLYAVDEDSDVYDPIGRTGIRVLGKFAVISQKYPPINNLKRALSQCNLEYDKIMPGILANAIAVLSEEEKEGVALVDIGANTIEVAIFIDKVLKHIEVLPFGGALITEDIFKGCAGISKDNAEHLKVRMGKAIPDDKDIHNLIQVEGLKGRPGVHISKYALAQIIESRLIEFTEILCKLFIENGVEYSLTHGIVLCGGVANTPHIAQLMEEVSGITVRLANPLEEVDYAGKYDTMLNSSHSVAIGLALSGYRCLDARDNDYYDEIRLYDDEELAKNKRVSTTSAATTASNNDTNATTQNTKRGEQQTNNGGLGNKLSIWKQKVSSMVNSTVGTDGDY